MNLWFTDPDAPIVKRWAKRFAPAHWTIDFPRGAMGAIVTGEDETSLTAHAVFSRRSDLVGLIFESEDRHAHPAHRRTTRRDYSRCQLQFRWRSIGLKGLDEVNGPTLTIEGRDAQGQARSWFVRLWNYAEGSPTDAAIRLDFDTLDAGFSLPSEAERVDPHDIDRMFISLVAPEYSGGGGGRLASPVEASVEISDIRCDGSGSMLECGDAVVPPHELRICTAYDDMYHLAPERVFDSVERLGFRKVITHYIGMSHYFALGSDGLVRPDVTMNAAALAWHRGFARAAKLRGYAIIWSLSYEILDMFCPEGWKQRRWDGSPALTGYDPPSTLVSPASSDGMQFLKDVSRTLVGLAVEVGMPVQVQIGEPWWWVSADGQPCIYDPAARTALLDPMLIESVRGPLSDAQITVLDRAGALLANSTKAIADTVRASVGARVLLLAYLPDILASDAPQLKRANLPIGWAKPAFETLQFEDYSWVTSGHGAMRTRALAEASRRLGYDERAQHYLAGFAGTNAPRKDWIEIVAAARDALTRGVSEVFLWALPQVLRDGVTLFGKDEDVQHFDDVLFPIEIGAEASVSPGYSTNVVTSASGMEFRNANWAQARLRFDAGPGIRGDGEMQRLLSFFRARRGSAVAFRFRDPYDWSSAGMTGAPSAADQSLGIGDGRRSRFALVKSYGGTEDRIITRPRSGTVRVSIDGVERSTGWVLDQSSVVFDVAPASGADIKAGFEFDVPVRFEQDRLDVHRTSFLAGEAPSVPLIEVREVQT